ncbi:MAG: RidA family protein [Acidimicrobiia bacterium]|nr:RidA family protein [Acidimicrobiia bacterium]
MSGVVDEKLEELGIVLPDPFPALGTFVSAVRTGSLVFTSGHVPHHADGIVTGKLGEALDVEDGYVAADLAARSVLATLRHELGDLDRVVRVVSVLGTVNATPSFVEHTAVVNGASDLFVKVFGDLGQHARLAVGVSSLPADLALEIQAVVEVT